MHAWTGSAKEAWNGVHGADCPQASRRTSALRKTVVSTGLLAVAKDTFYCGRHAHPVGTRNLPSQQPHCRNRRRTPGAPPSGSCGIKTIIFYAKTPRPTTGAARAGVLHVKHEEGQGMFGTMLLTCTVAPASRVAGGGCFRKECFLLCFHQQYLIAAGVLHAATVAELAREDLPKTFFGACCYDALHVRLTRHPPACSPDALPVDLDQSNSLEFPEFLQLCKTLCASKKVWSDAAAAALMLCFVLLSAPVHMRHMICRIGKSGHRSAAHLSVLRTGGSRSRFVWSAL
eukprot:351879-Chlamydomonas_euryale.AAC.15